MKPPTPMPPNPMIEQPAGAQSASAAYVTSSRSGQQAQQAQHETHLEGIRTGGCLCGSVRFRLKGQPLRTGVCHCQDCRRTSGSAFAFFAVWPRSAYDGSGELGIFAGRSFCTKCGSRVASLRTDEAELMLGCLDQVPSDLIPDYELWIGHRELWLLNLQWAEQFQCDRLPGAVDAPPIEPALCELPQQPGN